MSVALLCCRLPAAPALGKGPPGLGLRAICAERDAHDIARLTAAIAADATGPAAPRPCDRGLVAELASRPGRDVEAWLAIMPGREERPVGLISLVQGCAAAGVRHSIGWILVHPAVRRQGIARALVAHACSRAARLAAQAVWVECRSDWSEAMAFWRAVGFEDREQMAAAGAHQPDH